MAQSGSGGAHAGARPAERMIATGSPPPAGGRVAFVLKGYPRLSESFIAQEIRALEQRGLDIQIVSLRHPTDRATHPVHSQIRAPVLYLPEYLKDEKRRVFAAWRRARLLPGYAAARRGWLSELARDIAHLHAHFLHTPASVARYAAIMRGVRWSVSAHAKDIWTIPTWEKREKLGSAQWAVTCTADGRRHLTELMPPPGTVALSYHGLDFDR